MFSSAVLGDPQLYAWYQMHASRAERQRQQGYGTLNSLAFHPSELDKHRTIDMKLEDCRQRRKAAILRVSRIVQSEGA